jgi:plasmid maintenance system killer protein
MSLDEIIINRYNIRDWMSDILVKIDIISYKEEEQKLKTMESKLVELLSKEKKTELAIDEIEKML